MSLLGAPKRLFLLSRLRSTQRGNPFPFPCCRAVHPHSIAYIRRLLQTRVSSLETAESSNGPVYSSRPRGEALIVVDDVWDKEVAAALKYCGASIMVRVCV